MIRIAIVMLVTATGAACAGWDDLPVTNETYIEDRRGETTFTLTNGLEFEAARTAKPPDAPPNKVRTMRLGSDGKEKPPHPYWPRQVDPAVAR